MKSVAIRSGSASRFSFLAIALLSAAAVAIAALPSIYPDPSKAAADVAAAIKTAGVTHKRVILDFGGDWCTDCHVLDTYFHDQNNLPFLEANYILVHVNIGHMDANTSLAERYGVPLKKGVPALAVLDDAGKLIYSQKGGEFESMRHMQSTSVQEFLQRWQK